MKRFILVPLLLLLPFIQAKAQAWEALGIGIGFPGKVLCSAYDSTNQLLYVGGHFTYADGQEMNNIACYDGTKWFPVGGGISSNYSPQAEQMAVVNGILYVSGIFDKAGTTNCFIGFAAWDGAHWSAVPFMPGFKVTNLFAFENKLFIGAYKESTGSSATSIYTWNGSLLENAATGVGGAGTSSAKLNFAIHHSQLYVSGIFLNMRLGKWNGSSWLPIYNESNYCKSIISYHDTLLVSDGNKIWCLKNGNLVSSWIANFPSNDGGKMAVLNDTLFAIGSTNKIYWFNNFGAWITTATASGSTNNDNILILESCEMGLFTGGALTKINSKYAIGLSKRNGAVWDSITMFSFPDGDVNALVYDSLNNWLYAGGEFKVAGSVLVNNIAKWDGVSWSGLNGGISTSVKSLALVDQTLYALLYSSGSNQGNSVGNLGKWNGNTWSACATSPMVDEEKIVAFNDTLYLAGGEGHVKLNAGNCNWSIVGSLFNDVVYDVTKFKGQLFAGGKGAMIDTANLAVWNGSTWTIPAYLEGSIVSFTHFHDSLFVSLYNSRFFKSGDGINWFELDSTAIGTVDHSVFSGISHNDQLIATLNEYKAIVTLIDTGWAVLQPFFKNYATTIMTYDSFMVVGGSSINSNAFTGISKSKLEQPIADFIFNDTTICDGNAIVTVINQTSSPVSYFQWTIEPATASDEDDLGFFDPKLYFDSSGTYTITLVVANAFGSDTITKTAEVIIQAKPNVYVTGNEEICYGDTLELLAHGAASYYWGKNAVNISSWFDSEIQVYAPYNYLLTVTGYDSLGCSDTAKVYIHYNDTAQFNLNPSANSLICNGDSITLSVNGNDITYSWLPAESLSTDTGKTVIAFPSSETTYTVTATDSASGCSSVETKIVNVDFYYPITIYADDSLKCPSSSVKIQVNYSSAYNYQWLIEGVEIPGQDNYYHYAQDTGLYSCIITSEMCEKMDTQTLYLPSYPLINFTMDTVPHLCMSNPDQPMPAATPAGGYYSIGFQIFNEIKPSYLGIGTHVLKYNFTDTSGCVQFIADTFEIGPGIEAVFTCPIDTICIYYPPFLLTGGFPEGGTYSGDGVVDNVLYPYLTNGGPSVITYLYEDSTGCTASAGDWIMVHFCIGIDDPKHNLEITLFPNPSSGIVNVAFNSNASSVISIYDLSGHIVYPEKQFNTTEREISIDCSNLQSGMYFFCVETKGFKYFLKLSIL